MLIVEVMCLPEEVTLERWCASQRTRIDTIVKRGIEVWVLPIGLELMRWRRWKMRVGSGVEWEWVSSGARVERTGIERPLRKALASLVARRWSVLRGVSRKRQEEFETNMKKEGKQDGAT